MRAVALVALVAIAAVASGAGVEPVTALNWWETGLIYQVYPRSFKDSNGDGIGDLNGITSKLSFIKDTGFDAVWMSPIYLSPMYDFGYDITDYRQIAPEYGTMADFDNLMAEAKRLGLRVVMDYVPNHTSNESDWFVRSARREPAYENYYVWEDGREDPNNPGATLPPTNWVSVFRKSAWEYNVERGQYYLHQFVIGQPDLNYREPRVQQEMKDVIRFWLDKGVSGFRIDAINFMYEVDKKDFGGKFPDEPVAENTNLTPDDYDYLEHIYTKDLDETYTVIYDWRDILNEYIEKQGENKVMMTEAYADLDSMMRYYGKGNREGSVPFNFAYLQNINNQSNARDIKTVVDQWMTYMPSGKVANWVNGNHDQSRMASRQGTDRVDAMNMLALVLPGLAISYQGEEIGQTDGFVSWEDTKDPQACNTDDPVNYWRKSRDPNRTPYQWDSSAHAGFSNTTGSTWLPVADNYKSVNLAAQIDDPRSHYTFYKDMAHLKKTTALRFGDLDIRALSENVLVITRLIPGYAGAVGIMNLSDGTESVDLSSMRLLPDSLQVVASGVDCVLLKGTYVSKTNIQMTGHCALVLETVENCC